MFFEPVGFHRVLPLSLLANAPNPPRSMEPRAARFLVFAVVSPVLVSAPSWSQRHAGLINAQRARISPPPPPPMGTWSTEFVAHAAAAAGLNHSTFSSHDVDGSALLELAHAYERHGAIPATIDEASSQAGPKLRFLRRVRAWARSHEAPRPNGPPPPEPPFPPASPPPPPKTA